MDLVIPPEDIDDLGNGRIRVTQELGNHANVCALLASDGGIGMSERMMGAMTNPSVFTSRLKRFSHFPAAGAVLVHEEQLLWRRIVVPLASSSLMTSINLEHAEVAVTIL